MRNDKVFNIISIISVLLVFIAVYFYSFESSWEVHSKAMWVAHLMVGYLYLVCARTLILLGLSFYEYLNTHRLPEIEYPPLITIIIPAYNEGKVIKDSIRSASRIDYPNLNILVVDDGSTDDTFVQAKEMENDYRVHVVTKANGGKADALNFGLTQALGEYVFCMDADSVLRPDVFNHALPYFQADPELAAVAGTVSVGNTKSLLAKFQSLEYIIGLNFHKKAQSALNMVTIVPGPCGLFKLSVLKEIGGYDTSTFAEDCDLSMRIITSGHKIKYSPNMVAVTEAPDTFYGLCVQRYRWSRGTIQAILKNVKTLFTKEGFSFRNIFVMSYMVLETMLIPSINFLFAMTTLIFALYFEGTHLYGPFFFGLLTMDATIALYSVVFERQLSSLFFLSLFSRFTYGFSLEVMRFYSMIDELFKIPMKWGTISRKGMN